MLSQLRNKSKKNTCVIHHSKVLVETANKLTIYYNYFFLAGPSTSKPIVKYDNHPVTASKSFFERISFPKVITSPNAFLQQMEFQSDQVMQYEDTLLQNYARDIVPTQTLITNAIERIRKIQKTMKNEKYEEPHFHDMFLVELTNWFNTIFFTWVNAMPCTRCGNESPRPTGNYVENDVRVETYNCCGQTMKFHRYNDVAYLLKTRKGRCGEYANCFTFLCCALGYEARLVVATFDHVWTEVYSEGQKRWLHIDPSDNIIDAPLTYQYGWKRKIDYVTAYSKNGVQDVTFRYTNDFNKVNKF